MLRGHQSPAAITMIKSIQHVRLMLGWDLIYTVIPVRDMPWRGRCLQRRASGRRRRRATPLRSRGSANTGALVRLGMNILRLRSWSIGMSRTGKLTLEQLQACPDVDIMMVQISSTRVRIQGIRYLVVTRLVLERGQPYSESRGDSSFIFNSSLSHPGGRGVYLPRFPSHTTLPRYKD